MSGEARAPGWYPDPWGTPDERYFDGVAWARTTRRAGGLDTPPDPGRRSATPGAPRDDPAATLRRRRGCHRPGATVPADRAPTAAPPGWHPDPWAAASLRYWDGQPVDRSRQRHAAAVPARRTAARRGAHRGEVGEGRASRGADPRWASARSPARSSGTGSPSTGTSSPRPGSSVEPAAATRAPPIVGQLAGSSSWSSARCCSCSGSTARRCSRRRRDCAPRRRPGLGDRVVHHPDRSTSGGRTSRPATCSRRTTRRASSCGAGGCSGSAARSAASRSSSPRSVNAHRARRSRRARRCVFALLAAVTARKVVSEITDAHDQLLAGV